MQWRIPRLLLFSLLSLPVMADSNPTLDKQSGLIAWVLKQDGLELTLKQAYPEQILAFYLARGFPKDIAQQIANSCLFQTIAKNTLNTQDDEPGSNHVITIHQDLWQVKTSEGEHGIKLKESLDKQWKKQQLKPAARIAYRWATFPTEQSFRPKYPRGG